MIILDTNALIWWTTAPEKLSRKAFEAVEQANSETGILVSSISVWEVYLLVKKDKLRLSLDIDQWLQKVESLPSIQFVPMDNRIAVQSVDLPEFASKDPADRIIIATALQYGAMIVSSDKKILKYPRVQSIW